MKKILYMVLTWAIACHAADAQDEVRKLLDRYDYGSAVEAIDSLMACDNADSVSLAIEKARCLRRIFRAEEATATLSEVLHLDRFNVELMAEMAESHLQAGNTEDAFNWYSILSTLQPDNTYFKLCQARILHREKRYDESIGIFKQVAARDSLPEVLTMIGDGYRNLGVTDSALVYYDAVLKKRPENAAVMNRKADILLDAGKHEPVLYMTGSYLEKNPDDMTILPIYGLALHLNGQYPESIEAFEHQKELGDDSYAVHYYIGMNHYMMNRWPGAVAGLEKAYQIDSSDVKLVYQLANAHSHIHGYGSTTADGLSKESERLFAKAIEMLKPDSAIMHNIYGSMAIARHHAELFKDAIKYYELSYRYNPKNITALSAIAHCHERMKEYDKALEFYEKYLKLAKPGSSGYNFAKESIDYIRQEKFMEE